MADNQFDILIKFGLSKEKATEATNELKKLEEQTKVTGKEGVKQEELVVEATKKNISWKQQAREAIKGLTSQYPILGQAAQLALSPITLSFAAITAAVGIMIRKNAEALKSFGGFEQADVAEGLEARFKRLSDYADNIAKKTDAIAAVFKQFEAQENALNAFAKGAGVETDPTRMAQAAAEAGSRSQTEADRLRAIQGGAFNPNNPAVGDMAKLLPAFQAHRAAMLDSLNLIEQVRTGGAGVKGAASYLLKFGLTNPDEQAAKYQTELSRTDAQISGILGFAKRRGERGAAFAGANEAEVQAAAMFKTSAGFSSAGAGMAGKDAASAAKAMESAPANILAIVNNVVGIANAAASGKKQTDDALKALEAANRAANQRP